MKKNIFVKGMLLLSGAAMLAGCSDNYLNVAPETEPSTSMISTSLSAAKLALRGLGRAMECQYQEVTTANQYNGEAYVNTIYNDAWGSDYYNGLAMQQFGVETYKWNTMGQETATWVNNIPWNYSYGLIYMANGVLDGIDTCDGDEEEKAFVKAQALTYRAHGYIKLLQFFAPRWEDSNNGEDYCMVIRTSQSTENVPLSKMIDVKKQVYADLDSAIVNYDRANGLDREYKWETNKSVAQGLYSRAAMIFHDWDIAQKMAHDARQGYTIMDNNTLFAGFYQDNNDFMWCSGAEDSDIYYWSFGSHFANNGLYVKNWANIGAGFINLDLYNQLDPNDVRRGLFLTPDKIEDSYTTKLKANPAKLTSAAFWDKQLVNADNMQMNIGATIRDSKNPNKKWGLQNFVCIWGYDYLNNKFKGNMSEVIDPTDQFACYMAYGKTVEGGFAIAKGVQAKLYGCEIGCTYKFWSYAPYGTSHYSYMRAAEMCLTEAEAAYMAGDAVTAQRCLTEINKMRITGYKATNSGQALLDEIRLCRRIEMWGEGMGFSDMKRWNLPLVRRAWVADDPTSGNMPSKYAMTRQPNEQAGWRFMVPRIESQYNPLIDRNLLPQPGDYTSK